MANELGTSLGLGISLQGQPDMGFANLAQRNIDYVRQDRERQRKEEERKKEELDDAYSKYYNLVNVGDLDIYTDEVRKEGAALWSELLKAQSSGIKHPDTHPIYSEKIKGFLLHKDQAQKAADQLYKMDVEITNNRDKLKWNDDVAKARLSKDVNAFRQLTGNDFYNIGAGIEDIKKPFDYLKFKGQVKKSYSPYSEKTRSIDPKTGNVITSANTYYNQPGKAASLVIESDPLANDFYQKAYNELPDSEKERLTALATSDNGSGSAFYEFVGEDLFPPLKKERGVSYGPSSRGGEGLSFTRDTSLNTNIFSISQQKAIEASRSAIEKEIGKAVSNSGFMGKQAEKYEQKIRTALINGDVNDPILSELSDKGFDVQDMIGYEQTGLTRGLAESQRPETVVSYGFTKPTKANLKGVDGKNYEATLRGVHLTKDNEAIVTADVVTGSRVKNKINSDGTQTQEVEPNIVTKSFSLEENPHILGYSKGLADQLNRDFNEIQVSNQKKPYAIQPKKQDSKVVSRVDLEKRYKALIKSGNIKGSFNDYINKAKQKGYTIK